MLLGARTSQRIVTCGFFPISADNKVEASMGSNSLAFPSPAWSGAVSPIVAEDL